MSHHPCRQIFTLLKWAGIEGLKIVVAAWWLHFVRSDAAFSRSLLLLERYNKCRCCTRDVYQNKRKHPAVCVLWLSASARQENLQVVSFSIILFSFSQDSYGQFRVANLGLFFFVLFQLFWQLNDGWKRLVGGKMPSQTFTGVWGAHPSPLSQQRLELRLDTNRLKRRRFKV